MSDLLEREDERLVRLAGRLLQAHLAGLPSRPRSPRPSSRARAGSPSSSTALNSRARARQRESRVVAQRGPIFAECRPGHRREARQCSDADGPLDEVSRAHPQAGEGFDAPPTLGETERDLLATIAVFVLTE